MILYPLLEDGSLCNYYDKFHNKTVNLSPNKVFHDVLILDSSSRGRSSVVFYFKSKTTGASYPMFLSELTKVIKKKEIKEGVVEGCWTFRKRGKSYSIGLKED